ncbi:MAG: response regulator [Elusimicrobiota bacterium]|nr:response regulator [Elusimicrobiota bacterium]
MSGESKILIIDDDPDALETMSAILETRDYQVFTALSGSEGIDKAVKEKPDLIIMDVMMPGLDGFATCKMIKENEETKDIPVILLTGKELVHDMEKVRAAGAKEFMIKPIDWDKLFLKIKNLIP